jgi:putative heme-binding domain-containing protein
MSLFDEGGKLAPELTGAQRSNIDYLLENVVDPNAVVWDRYKAIYFETTDDRLISGVVLAENESAITIQTQTGAVTLPRTEIASRRQSEVSMMPEGLFELWRSRKSRIWLPYFKVRPQVPAAGQKLAYACRAPHLFGPDSDRRDGGSDQLAPGGHPLRG